MIFKYYPHTIERYVPGSGYTDGNGDFHETAGRYVGKWRCDAVRNQSGTYTFDDGTVKKYSYSVHLLKCDVYFRIGDKVRITFRDGRRQEFDVISFQPFQTKMILLV